MNQVIPFAKEALRRAVSHQAVRLTGSVSALVSQLRPVRPLYIFRPEQVVKTAQDFMRAFPGETMFAVKTNPHDTILLALAKAGMNSFDAASIEEVRTVRRLLGARPKIYFMHTVKSPEAIAESYFKHRVRAFSLDCMEELNKIITHTKHAKDLTLFVRLALPRNDEATIDFSGKFGASCDEAIALLKASRLQAAKIGLCFHVGTQTHDPSVYDRAVSIAATVIRESGVSIDMLDVGGGFPVPYPGEEVPELAACMDALSGALVREKLDHIPLLAEPGRALVAQSGSLVVRVELRKGDRLYINDGTYGGLFDAGKLLGQIYPARAMRVGGVTMSEEMAAFSLAGPTCDSLDMMEGPFMLPADIRSGDWIEIEHLGAYSYSMRTNFNGFGAADIVCLYEQRSAGKVKRA